MAALTIWSFGVRVEYVIRDSHDGESVEDDIGANCLSGVVFRRGKGVDIIEFERASIGRSVRRVTIVIFFLISVLPLSPHYECTQEQITR